MTNTATPWPSEPPKNIIVRMPNWIGDLVMATPVLEDLFYPDSRRIAAAARDLVEGAKTGWMPEERSDLKRIEFKGPF